MSTDPTEPRTPEPPSEAPPEAETPRRRGAQVVRGFSPETLRRLSGWTVSFVPTLPTTARADADAEPAGDAKKEEK